MASEFDPYYQWLGIPPAEQPPHHYRLLTLQLFEANLDVISTLADQRMGHLRTFANGPHSDLSQQLLNEVSTAKLCLLNAEKKAVYDAQLRQQLALQQTRLPRAVSVATPVVPLVFPAAQMPVSLVAPHPAAGILQEAGEQASEPNSHEMPSFDAIPQDSATFRRPTRRVKGKPLPLAGALMWGASIPVAILFALVIVKSMRPSADGRSQGPSETIAAVRREGPPDLQEKEQTELNPEPSVPDATEPAVIGRKLGPSPSGGVAAKIKSGKPDSLSQQDGSEHKPPSAVSASDGEPATSVDDQKSSKPPPSEDGTISLLAGRDSTDGHRRLDVKPGEMVDVLKLIDPGRDSIGAHWRREKDVLISPSAWAAKLQTIVAPPSDYVVRLVGERKQGADCLGIGLVVDGRQVLAEMDGYGGTCSGLHWLDSRWANSNASTKRIDHLFKPNVPYSLTCTVTPKSVRIFVDDQTIIDWHGEARRLGAPPEWSVPQRDKLYLGSMNSVHEIRELTIEPLVAWQVPDAVYSAKRTTTANSTIVGDPLHNASRDALGTSKAAQSSDDGLDLEAAGSGLLAQYYYNKDFTHPVLAIVESTIEHRWNNSSFGKGFHSNGFFARYTGWLTPPTAGEYMLKIGADDGVRMWVDGRLVFDEWRGQAGIFKKQIFLEQRPHAVRIEYFQSKGPATLVWRWKPPGVADFQRIAADCLQPARLAELPESTRNASAPNAVAVQIPAAPANAPAAAQPNKPVTAPLPLGQWIDLLALVDPANHAVKGHWQRRGTDIVCDATDSPRFIVPVTVSGRYELKCEFTRRAGDDATFLLIPVGESGCAVLVSAVHGASSGLEMLDGRVVNDIAPSTGASVRPGFITNDLRHQMHVEISQGGAQAAISASFDNRPFVNWRGNVNQLSRTGWEILPCSRAIGVMTNRCNVEFHKLELRIGPGGAGYLLGSDWQNPLCVVAPAPPREIAAKCLNWGSHSYLFSEKPMNLSAAQRLASGLQGRLLTISSEPEESFITQSARGMSLWTAGWRAALTTQWRDERNRPLKYLPKWAPGQFSTADETFLAFSTAADNSRGLHDCQPDAIWNVCIEWGEE